MVGGSKLKGPDDCEVSRLLVVAVGAKLNLDVLLMEDCLDSGSFWALGANTRCGAGGFERPLWATLNMSTSILKLGWKAGDPDPHTASMETRVGRWVRAKLVVRRMYDP